jgi:Domain of unknown function (DUF4157)
MRESVALATSLAATRDRARDGARPGPLAAMVPPAPGRPLDPQTRGFAESRFERDFSTVRVHSGHAAGRWASHLGAAAYTVGEEIVFGYGRFAPATDRGRRLLAHELAHVVQQRRGGGPHASVDDGVRLERAAGRAASQVVARNGTPVEVAGAAAPGIMCKPEGEEEEEGDEPAPREKEKARDLQRRRERARAGKSDAQLTASQAEEELRALERSYRQAGAKSRSLERKKADLKRYEKLLERTGGPQLSKNQRKGAFDELQRTPSKTVGSPQTKHVAGGRQLPGQELRPGKDSYAQPDYTITRRAKDGRIERVHVNLKSDKIDTQSVAKARATGRVYLAQAIRNSKHLATGESITISFARTPPKEVQDALRQELFAKDSPIGELRFGTTTHKRADYKPPPSPPPPLPASKTVKRAKAPKAPAAKVPKASAAKAPKATKVPAARTSAAPRVAVAKATKVPAARTPAAPRVAVAKAPVVPKVAVPKAPVVPKVAVPKAPVVPKVGAPKAPTVPTGAVGRPGVGTVRLPVSGPKIGLSRTGGTATGFRPARGGGLGRQAMAEGVAAAAVAIIVPIINHYLQEHFAASFAEQARQLIAKAIEDHRPDFDALIAARLPEIQKVQAEGREVRLHVIVHTNWQDTDLGRVLTRAYVARSELAFEDGPMPAPYEVPRPGGRVGDVVRYLIGTSFSYETFDIPLEGTDPEAADRRLRRELITTKLRSPTGAPEVPFEWLIVSALEQDRPLDDLQDYVAYRLELAASHPSAGPAMAEFAHWSAVGALLQGPLEDLIAAARAKNVSLEVLRAVAIRRSSGAAHATAAAYWSEVVRVIDAKPR